MDWRKLMEICIKFSDAPANITTEAVYRTFSQEGTVVFIEIYRHHPKTCKSSGIVKFSPPPRKDFWKNGDYPVKFFSGASKQLLKVQMLGHDVRLVEAPLGNRSYPERMTLIPLSVGVGYMHQDLAMNTMYFTTGKHGTPMKFIHDLKFRAIEILFPVSTKSGEVLTYKSRILHSSNPDVFLLSNKRTEVDVATIVLHLESPPEFFVMAQSGGLSPSNSNSKVWSENDLWRRHGNVLEDADEENSISLNVSNAIVNVGRWRAYCLQFDISGPRQVDFEVLCNTFKDFNITIKSPPSFNLTAQNFRHVWELIDHPRNLRQADSMSLAEIFDEKVTPLPFELRYQLEVCISENLLSEYRIQRKFLDRLHSMEPGSVKSLLEDVAGHKKQFLDPIDIFDDSKLKKTKPKKQKLKSFCTAVRSAIITPTTVYFTTPILEISNRVIRQYAQYSDNFLRVKFTEERPHGRIYVHQKTERLLQRVREALKFGVSIGDRNYEFLAFGNSQIREHSAYFFNSVPSVTAQDIREWMGRFDDIKSVAKYAARLGQCFSTTRPVATSKTLIEIPDVFDATNTYNFTDGVGKISKALAVIAAADMKIPMANNEPPSVLQFRLAGCKGVLAVWDLPGMELQVRPSQYKFYAAYEGLEVIKWSQFSAAHLNQQLILVLSSLGVDTAVFLKKLRQQLSNLEDAMNSERTAISLLRKEVDSNQTTLVLSQMVTDGFQKSKEPFVSSILKLWRAWNIKYLKEKAKIAIHGGGVFLGCTDENRILKGHSTHIQPPDFRVITDEERISAIPEIFVQLSKGGNNRPEVKTGYMVLARNPSLHPGDVRVVRGVDRPELRHLKDVVVLPQIGDRDVASMCSGGDLDGDDYLVIWDEDLLPRVWNYPPMNFTSPAAKEKTAVTIEDVKAFFIEYMRNDNLSTIALAHRAQADHQEDGVLSHTCVELAKLHSQAVDFPKTGQAAIMDVGLKPRRWPHWMGKPKEISYVSSMVLGVLYDEVELVNFEPDYEGPFDSRILRRYQPENSLIKIVSEIKERYDQAIRRIMSQYDIKTEFEVWSTFVLQHNKHQGSDYKFYETMGQLSTALKETFRDECYEKAGGRDLRKIGPFVAAMYYVTNSDIERVKESWKRQGLTPEDATNNGEDYPLISFPWLFPSILGRVAKGEQQDHIQVTVPEQQREGVVKKDITKQPILATPEEDTMKTSRGVMQIGDRLELFQEARKYGSRTSDTRLGFEDETESINPLAQQLEETLQLPQVCLLPLESEDEVPKQGGLPNHEQEVASSIEQLNKAVVAVPRRQLNANLLSRFDRMHCLDS